MKNNHTRNLIDNIKEKVGKPKFNITGFDFVLDNPNYFEPCTEEACKTAGFFDENQPYVDGFFYLSEEYDQYLKTANTEHPANTEELPWNFQ